MERIGLIPAAGYARRLGKTDGSKEMITVNSGRGKEPVCSSLIRQFENAGIKNVVLVTRRDKKDLLQYIESSLESNVVIETIILGQTNSTIESICAAYDLIRGKEVYLGFPDVIVSPEDAMRTLLNTKRNSLANVVLGAFPANEAGKVDMIDIGPNNKLVDIDIKNPDCMYKLTWIIACWDSDFTEYLCKLTCLDDLCRLDEEAYLGDVFLYYLKSGHNIEVHSYQGDYLDIGTPEDLASLN